MINKFENDELTIITDTHFGRQFKEGVPLDRRGEYEEDMYHAFEQEIANCKTHKFVHAGDLFDSPFVSNEVLMRVYNIIAKNWQLGVSYIFIAGNHDLSKDHNKFNYTSFHILKTLLKNNNNITFVEDGCLIENGKYCYVPYSYSEDLSRYVENQCEYLIGHFEDPVPEKVAKFKNKKFSGHFHKRHMSEDGTFFIGSALPIAFGEESDDEFMETMTLDEYNSRNEEDLRYKRIRLLLKDGQELPTEFKCRQLIAKKVSENKELELEIKETGNFDLKSLFFECTKDSGMSEELWSRYLNLKG